MSPTASLNRALPTSALQHGSGGQYGNLDVLAGDLKVFVRVCSANRLLFLCSKLRVE